MMENKKTVIVVQVTSESGDHYGPFVFASKPSHETLEAFLRSEIPEEEFNDMESCSPGFSGTYIDVDISENVKIN